MNFLRWIGYSIANGFAGLAFWMLSKWWWILGIVVIALVYWQETREIEDRYVDAEREIL